MASDCGRVREDSDAEDDDHTGRKLATDTELITEKDDERGNKNIGDERDDENLVVEDAVKDRANATEHRIERSDHGNGQIGLKPDRHSRMQNHAEDDPYG